MNFFIYDEICDEYIWNNYQENIFRWIMDKE